MCPWVSAVVCGDDGGRGVGCRSLWVEDGCRQEGWPGPVLDHAVAVGVPPPLLEGHPG